MSEPVVYLVDDDVEFCQLIEKSIMDLGISFQFFTNPQDYLKSLSIKVPTVSLIDLRVSRENVGFELLSKARELSQEPHPLIVISGKKDMVSISYALELGASDYITKPIDPRFFIAKLAQYIQTDEMYRWAQNDVELPDGGQLAKMQLKAEIVEIDEGGVKFITPHLFAKGTVVHIEASIFQEIFGQKKSPLLTVLNMGPCPDRQGYEIYAELSTENENITRCIRNWVSEKNNKAAA